MTENDSSPPQATSEKTPTTSASSDSLSESDLDQPELKEPVQNEQGSTQKGHKHDRWNTHDPLHRVWDRIEDSWGGIAKLRRWVLPKAAADIPLLPSAEHTVIVVLAAFIGLYAGLAATFLRTLVHVVVVVLLRPARLMALWHTGTFERLNVLEHLQKEVRYQEFAVLGTLGLLMFVAFGIYRHLAGERGQRSRAFLIGILLAAAAFGHVVLQAFVAVAETLRHSGQTSLDLLDQTPWWSLLLMSAVGGIFVGVLAANFKGAQGEGVPDVMVGVALKGGHLDVVDGAAFAGASTLTAAALGSAGLEGPVVVLGSTTASRLGEMLSLPRAQLRLLAAAGAAAGISASFNAPIAGALFALEIIVGDFALANFSPVVIASVLGTVVRRSIEGDGAVLALASFELISGWELLLYAGLGLVCGIFGAFFVKAMEGGRTSMAKSMGWMPLWLRPAVGIGVLVVIAKLLGRTEILGSGYDAMGRLLTEPLGLVFVGTMIIGKVAATVITFGAGGVGGVMFPSLLIGAATGHFFGGVARHIFGSNIASPSAYAVVGMGAFLTAVQQAPLTATVMVFEFTNDYTIVMPLLVACIVSTLLSTRALGSNVYQRALRHQGIVLARGKDQTILANITVAEAMETETITMRGNTPLNKILDVIAQSGQTTFPVLNQQDDLIGIFSVRDLQPILFEEDLHQIVVAADIMTAQVITVSPENTFREALSAFSFRRFDHLVVAGDDGKVLGLLSRDALLEVYRAHLERGELPIPEAA